MDNLKVVNILNKQRLFGKRNLAWLYALVRGLLHCYTTPCHVRLHTHTHLLAELYVLVVGMLSANHTRSYLELYILDPREWHTVNE